MHKIEILIEREFLPELLRLLSDQKIEGYTVLDVREGKGFKQGASLVLGLSGQSGVLVFAVCEHTVVAAVLPPLRAFLRTSKGFAFVTPVEMVVT